MGIMETIIVGLLAGGGSVLLYFIMGIGAANAERKAKGSDGICMFTVFLWPFALVCWCFDDSI